jgi:cell division protein FtsW (lipid II flippase)
MGFKKGRLWLAVRNVLLYCLLGVLFLLVISKVFPTNIDYIINRFSELTNPQLARGPNDLNFRFTMSRNVISNIDEEKKIIGMGSVTEYQTYWAVLMKEALADMVWTGVIFRWGFVGLILFILLYIFSLFKAFILFMKSDGVVSDLALLVLLYLFSQIIESFIDWIFMSEHGYATGLWYFAILSLILGYKKSEISPDRDKVY